MDVAVVGMASYLVGSLPFGLWVGLALGVDIRTLGSGNIGATNVWRNLGWRAGLLVFLLDVLKGFGPAVGGGLALAGDAGFVPEYALFAGGLAVVGHSASVFLRFRGGKGVATALGVMLAATPEVAGLSLAVWVSVLLLTRYVSAGSVLSAVFVPLCAFFFSYPVLIYGPYALLAALLVVRHIPNIKRLAKGEELRFSLHTSPSAPESGAVPALRSGVLWLAVVLGLAGLAWGIWVAKSGRNIAHSWRSNTVLLEDRAHRARRDSPSVVLTKAMVRLRALAKKLDRETAAGGSRTPHYASLAGSPGGKAGAQARQDIYDAGTAG